jgi:hypothetical protein
MTASPSFLKKTIRKTVRKSDWASYPNPLPKEIERTVGTLHEENIEPAFSSTRVCGMLHGRLLK